MRPEKIFLNRNMTILEDDTYAVPMLKFLSVTIGSLVNEDMMQLFWASFEGEHLVC